MPAHVMHAYVMHAHAMHLCFASDLTATCQLSP
jgi:hypothetical protein